MTSVRPQERVGRAVGSPVVAGRWSADELDAVLDALPARITLWDRQRRLRYANSVAEQELLSMPREDAVGRSMAELVHWFDTRDAGLIQTALAGRPQRYLRGGIGRDGAEDHRLMHLDPHRVDGRVVGVLITAVDANPRVAAEQATYANAQAAAVLRDRWQVAAALHPSVSASCRAALRALTQLLADPTDTASRLTAVDRIDEAIGVLRETVRALRDDPVRSQPRAAGPSSHRLSARRPGTGPTGRSGLAEDDLLAVLDLLPVEVTGWTRAMHNTFANRAAMRTYGVTRRDDLLGRHAADLAGDEDFRASVRFARAAWDGMDQTFVREVRGPDGRRRHAQVDYLRLPKAASALGGLALVVDITEQVGAERAERAGAERVRLMRERARLAATLHDDVVQRLFAAGLALSAQDGLTSRQAIQTAVTGIDDALTYLGATLTDTDLPDEPVQRVDTAVLPGPRIVAVP